MNNQDCNAVDYKPELRRSSRNKLSTSKKRERKVPTQNSVPFQTSVQKIDLSPKKKLPLITESPSPCQRQKSNDCVDVVTPKVDKTHSFIETPYKDEVLVCSQHFDSQSDVAWDCRSPDAIVLRRGSRRRHYSDVSNIITQLHVCEDEEEAPVTRAPLVGLWVNDSSTIQNDSRTNRERKRKNRVKTKAKSSTGNDSLSNALAERLRLALEQCEDSPCKGDVSTEDVRKRSASVGDESRDLFASQVNDEDEELDESWSDDELFEDDSFILKATQVECEPKSNKRKLNSYNSDEPPVKTGKYFENQKLLTKPGKSPCNRFSKVMSKASPFKKHKSFNDRSEYEKSKEMETKQYTQYSSGNNVGRAPNNMSSVMCFTSKHSMSKVSTQSVSETVLSVGVVKQSASNITPVTRLSSSITRPVVSHMAPHVNTTSVTQGGQLAGKQTHTTTQNSTNCLISSSQHCRRSYPNISTSNVSASKNISSRNSNTVPVCAASTLTIKNSKGVPTTVNNGIVTSSNQNTSGLFKFSSAGQVQSPCSRRISGTFDTSLSDDLLCQLIEPDEILESQVCSKVDKTHHIDEALSFFHEVPKTKSEVITKNSKNTERYFGSDINKDGAHLSSHSAKFTFKSGKCSSNYSAYSKKDLISNKNGGNIEDLCSVGVSNNLTNVKKEPISYIQNVVKQEHCAVSTQIIQPVSTFRPKTPRSSYKKAAYAMDNASEDLFMSDGEDELSERQMWEILDNVESTQHAKLADGANSSIPKKDFESTKQTCKYSPDEIEKKRLEALRRKHLKERQPHETISQCIDSEICTPPDCQTNKSPFKCSPDEIEKKRLEALKRKQQRETKAEKPKTECLNWTLSTPTKSHYSYSPFKNSPDEKQHAFKREGHEIIEPDIGSPVKCSQEEIEQKRKEAMKRLQAKRVEHCQELSPVKCTSEKMPIKCSPEDIEKKRQAALLRRQHKYEQDISMGHSNSLDESSKDDKLRKKQNSHCKMLQFQSTNTSTTGISSKSEDIISSSINSQNVAKPTNLLSDQMGTRKGSVTAEEIELKKQIALQKRNEKLKKQRYN